MSGPEGFVPAELQPPIGPLSSGRERHGPARRRRAMFVLICVVVICELLVIAAVGTYRAQGGSIAERPSAAGAMLDRSCSAPCVAPCRSCSSA